MALQAGRRNFIAALGFLVAWPLAARAQQASTLRRVGVLMNVGANDSDFEANLAAFLHALHELGWTDGRNVQIEVRWGGGTAAGIRKQAVELVAGSPDVILATGTAAMRPFLQASAPFRSYSSRSPIRSALALSIPWPGRAAMLRDSFSSNTV